ncbi:MAG: hypothetical protein Q9210_004871 [Variospora velana]
MKHVCKIYTPLLHTRRLNVSALVTPPLVFTGLLLSLWTYKCLMLVLFQNKIIYMPSVPPFSRSEKIQDYEAQCRPVRWEETRIRAADGVEVALAVGSLAGSKPVTSEIQKHVAIVYFQGNGGSLPPRLPALSSILKALQRDAPSSTSFTIVGLSYRGFWTSRGRPSERGIGRDAAAAIHFALTDLPASDIQPTSLILWGQSIGAGVATAAAAAIAPARNDATTGDLNSEQHTRSPVSGLLLETPFVSVRAMLTTIYPQKWLPYRYLGPFLRNHWDSRAALKKIASSPCSIPKVLILQAANDELVPNTQSLDLEGVCQDLQMEIQRKVVSNALHTEVATKAEGRRAIVNFLGSFG